MSFLRFIQGASGGLAAGRFVGGKLDGNSKMCLIVCLDFGLIMTVLNSKHSLVVYKYLYKKKKKKMIKQINDTNFVII